MTEAARRYSSGRGAVRTARHAFDPHPRYASGYPQYGDIFGGWLLGQMDIAGGIVAANIAKSRTATVAVDAMTFRKPVYVGDVMCIYTDLIRVGTTSIRIHVEAWVIRRNQTSRFLVTEGNFTYVALDDERRPRQVQR